MEKELFIKEVRPGIYLMDEAHEATGYLVVGQDRACVIDTMMGYNDLHQAVRKLAPALEAMALSPDGLIEAAYMPGKKFLWAVQWHPEFSYKTDAYSRMIFSAFVESMA